MSPRLEKLDVAPPVQGPLHMDAVLRPNRSLSARGFNRVMLLLGGISLAACVMFVLNGAWPVIGFFGLEVLAIWFAFRVSYRQAKLTERVRVTPEVIHVERVQPNGVARHWTASPVWARVEHEEEGPDEDAVRLASGGRRLALGRFLAPEERVSFAAALRSAIFKARSESRGAGTD